MEPNQPNNMDVPVNPIMPAPVAPSTIVMANGNSVVGGGEPEKKKVGPIMVILVIVLVLIFVALYFLASRINQQSLPTDIGTIGTEENLDVTSPQTAEVAQSVPKVTNTADDPSSLQADLNASTNGLDQQNF